MKLATLIKTRPSHPDKPGRVLVSGFDRARTCREEGFPPPWMQEGPITHRQTRTGAELARFRQHGLASIRFLPGRIGMIRNNFRLTWDELAFLLGTSRRTAQNWHDGRHEVSPEKFLHVSSIYEVLRKSCTESSTFNRTILFCNLFGESPATLLAHARYRAAWQSLTTASTNLDPGT